VISQHRFDAGLHELRQLLDSGALGSLLLGEASTKWYRTQGYYDSAAWRGTWDLDGGSLMNQGIHYVDLLRWCMGPVTEVTAICATEAHEVEVEDTALAIVKFASGALGTIVSSTAVYPGFNQRLEITGTSGTVTVENGRIARRALNPQNDPQRSAAGAPSAPGGSGPGGTASAGTDEAASYAGGIDPASHAAQLADLLTAIDEGRPPSVTAQDGRNVLEIVCAVYESARDGRPVVLPAAPAPASS
jgi:UDP-N-acetyl-2-amino-2-deoxyglucuronate dehydrogenase